ncbi:MAG TPA: DUF4145 domain-containing protein [Ignavibacteriaceae bacterium]|nr:DUF4145 domain-containing protein [Ignavibacteriaceae bacterium]
MYKIPKFSVSSWLKIDNDQLPKAVDINCPFCQRKISFTLNSWNKNLHTRIYFTKSSCPSCGKTAYFINLNIPELINYEEGGLFIFPEPKIKNPMYGTEQSKKFSPMLNRTYHSALNVYNTREWSATAVICRKLLEGILKSLLPNDLENNSIYKQLQSLPSNIDLSEPILMLADAIRKAGNLGAHFDLEKEPDEKIATLMIDLIEYLIEYIYVLPTRIEELHYSINELEKSIKQEVPPL